MGIMSTIPVVDGDVLPNLPVASIAAGAGAASPDHRVERRRVPLLPGPHRRGRQRDAQSSRGMLRSNPRRCGCSTTTSRRATAGDALCMTLTEVAFRAGSLQLAQLRPTSRPTLYGFRSPQRTCEHRRRTRSGDPLRLRPFNRRRGSDLPVPDAPQAGRRHARCLGRPSRRPAIQAGRRTCRRTRFSASTEPVLQTPDAAQYAHGYRFRPHTQCRGHRGGEFDRSAGDRATADPGGRGLLVTMLPWVPNVSLHPEWILIGVLPPLLYSAAVSMPTMEFRRNLAPIKPRWRWWCSARLRSGFCARTVARRVVVDGDRDRRHRLADRRGGHADDQEAGAPKPDRGDPGGRKPLNDATALVLLRTAIAAAAAGVSVGGAFGDFVWSVPS